MDATTKDKIQEATAKAEPKKKRSFGQAFMNFLMMGGFLVILVGVAAIFILVSYLTK